MFTTSPERKKALFMLILAAILWSTGGLLIKSVPIHPLAIAGTRSGIASLIVLLFLGRPRFTWSIPQIGGALSYAATVTLFVFATKLTTAANAILLEYTAPVYIALLGSWFLGERTTVIDWLMIGACLFGMILFFFDSLAPGQLLGNVCGVLTGITFAFLAIFLRKQKNTSNLESIFLGNVVVAVVGIPFLAFGIPDTEGLLSLAALGALQLGLPYILYAWAIKQVTALDSILIPIIEPILNPLWVFLLIGERPGPWAVTGGAIVLAAVTIRSTLMVREKMPPPAV
jgi:drug/metabolite transporter (DMT)-like permease